MKKICLMHLIDSIWIKILPKIKFCMSMLIELMISCFSTYSFVFDDDKLTRMPLSSIEKIKGMCGWTCAHTFFPSKMSLIPMEIWMRTETEKKLTFGWNIRIRRANMSCRTHLDHFDRCETQYETKIQCVMKWVPNCTECGGTLNIFQFENKNRSHINLIQRAETGWTKNIQLSAELFRIKACIGA